jgi:hypothetical protein
MTKKRRIKSTLYSEPKPQFTRAVLSVALVVVIAIGLGGVARAQTEVYPTGDPAIDLPAVQSAVDAGGTVILKATPTYFNFEAGIVEINDDVVILGEPGSISLPDGRMADRTTIYGGGGTGFPGYGDPGDGGTLNRAGAFTVVGGSFEIKGLWLDSSSFASIFVRGCNGATISDNVITYTRRVQSVDQWWVSWAKPISFGEWESDQIFGDIIIEGNYIGFNPNPPIFIWYAEGISLHWITSNPMPNISIIGNTILNPGKVWRVDDPWMYRFATGISCWHPATIRDNTIRGSWSIAVYSESVVSWPTIIAGSVIEGNLIQGLVPGEGCKISNSALNVACSNNSVVRNNTVSGTTGWYGINVVWAPGTDVTANTVSVTGESGICVKRHSNGTTVKQNTIQNFHSLKEWGAPIWVVMASNCIVTNNTLIDVYDPDNYAQGKGPIAGIRVAGYGTWDVPCTNNIILGNDYKKSGLPGWNKNHPTGPGCVVLEADWWGPNYGAAIGNYVSEDHHAYPAGTTICEQILDMTATPENPDGENTEVGMEKCPEVSDYIDRLRDQAEREREEQELQEEEQQLLEELSLEGEYPLP